MYRRSGRAKLIGTCGHCGQNVWGPPMARFVGVTKSPCKKCREDNSCDAADRSEREYFRKMSAEYQMEVQGFVSSI